ncbi:hypothetical protein GCM10020254_48750 [Streptomyces goshikiensis]
MDFGLGLEPGLPMPEPVPEPESEPSDVPDGLGVAARTVSIRPTAQPRTSAARAGRVIATSTVRLSRASSATSTEAESTGPAAPSKTSGTRKVRAPVTSEVTLRVAFVRPCPAQVTTSA